MIALSSDWLRQFQYLKSSLRKFYGRYGDLTKQYEVPLTLMLQDILDDNHIQWHPPLIWHYINFGPLLIMTLLPNSTFYVIVQGFHRTYATSAACEQRTLTPPDTWSCPTFGLACVLMSRPISPELVLSPDVWISNIPRYFSFAFYISNGLTEFAETKITALAYRLRKVAYCTQMHDMWHFEPLVSLKIKNKKWLNILKVRLSRICNRKEAKMFHVP